MLTLKLMRCRTPTTLASTLFVILAYNSETETEYRVTHSDLRSRLEISMHRHIILPSLHKHAAV